MSGRPSRPAASAPWQLAQVLANSPAGVVSPPPPVVHCACATSVAHWSSVCSWALPGMTCCPPPWGRRAVGLSTMSEADGFVASTSSETVRAVASGSAGSTRRRVASARPPATWQLAQIGCSTVPITWSTKSAWFCWKTVSQLAPPPPVVGLRVSESVPAMRVLPFRTRALPLMPSVVTLPRQVSFAPVVVVALNLKPLPPLLPRPRNAPDRFGSLVVRAIVPDSALPDWLSAAAAGADDADGFTMASWPS
jgi:hypothetical protein